MEANFEQQPRIMHTKNAPLEQKQRLSKSILWKAQRNFYVRQGIEAWRSCGLPYYVTSNPFIADAYARIVFAFLRDSQLLEAGNETTPVRPVSSQPIYIVELGSGHGHFSYLFLKRFLKLFQNSRLADLKVKYVMTDFAESNLDYWRAHSWLQPFVEQGILDFARFDIEQDQELKLVVSGDVLAPEASKSPVVLIANYVFDSIAQDAFRVEGGQLYESLVTIHSPQKEPDPESPDILSRIEISYDQSPVNSEYYHDADWDRLLKDYQQRLPGTAFLFPIAALRCIRYFRALSGDRLLLLSADKGYSRNEALLLGHGLPGIVIHGSFSMMVDYHLIGDYFLRNGGQVQHPTHEHESLNISAFLFGKPAGGYVETCQAYERSIEDFGPDDFFTLMRGIERYRGDLTLEQTLALLRLSACDYRVLIGCLPTIKEQLPNISESRKQELFQVIRQVWDLHYPIGEETDLAFLLGTLLLEMEFYTEALEFLQHSVALYGMEPGTAYNMAVCYYSLRQMQQALAHVNQALELDPEFDAAKAMRIKLESSHSRATT